MLPRLHRLLDHLEWADRRALEAIRSAEREEGRGLLAHVLAAERVWLRRLRAGGSAGAEIWPDSSLEECALRLAENATDYRSFLESLDESDLDAEVAYRNSRGVEFRTPVVEILLHVFLHGAYHRGQIALRLRDADGEPVNTDFITFVRETPGKAGH